MSPKLTTEIFIEKAKITHCDTYDYSKVDYKNAKTKVIIICKIHGEFSTLPSNHTSSKDKRGCPKCAIKRNSDRQRFTKEQFIEKATEIHKDKYDYSLVEYKNIDTEVIIICKTHGEFKQTPYIHINLNGGCKKCSTKRNSDKQRFTKEQFIEKAKITHRDTYDYSKVDYVSDSTKVIIICKKHGEFKQSPNNHYKKKGCPNCSNKKSENLCREILEEYTGLNFPTIRPNFLNNDVSGFNLELDGYCEDLKLAFEYQGKQHYEYIPYFHRKEGSFEKQQQRDKLKLELCKKYDINVIIIPYKLDYQNEKELRYFIKEELQKLLGDYFLLF